MKRLILMLFAALFLFQHATMKKRRKRKHQQKYPRILRLLILQKTKFGFQLIQL